MSAKTFQKLCWAWLIMLAIGLVIYGGIVGGMAFLANAIVFIIVLVSVAALFGAVGAFL